MSIWQTPWPGVLAILAGVAGLWGVARSFARRSRAHRYLSTGCLHGEHGYCQSNTGSNGAKVPATCKFCAAPCVCKCHQGAGQ